MFISTPISLSRLDGPVSGQEGPLQRERPLLHHLQDQPGQLRDIGNYNHLMLDDMYRAFCVNQLPTKSLMRIFLYYQAQQLVSVVPLRK